VAFLRNMESRCAKAYQKYDCLRIVYLERIKKLRALAGDDAPAMEDYVSSPE
jgi:hypothetical protein